MRHGEINLLNGFGAGMEPMWGALIASGTGTAAAIGTRMLTTPGSMANRWSEGIGLLIGCAAAGGMIAYPATREAGKLGLWMTLVNQGLRTFETFLSSRSSEGVGWVVPEGANPALGMPSAQQIAGLGYPMAVRQAKAYGTVPGVAGPAVDGKAPVQLLAPNNGKDMAALYGATHFSRT